VQALELQLRISTGQKGMDVSGHLAQVPRCLFFFETQRTGISEGGFKLVDYDAERSGFGNESSVVLKHAKPRTLIKYH